ncbi:MULTISPECIES: hypothetical protein [unclassified Methylobacterium]|uniref:hypothetical protein n=1 Tax=unclassified Methylobacterium TaxID=2615210 RepID=UPI0006FB758F|nr:MULTISPECIES: hypothetical protein [unclassified Methylobacterium]MCK2053148.1 hypothetical protein [Methylobacterium sp. 37f]
MTQTVKPDRPIWPPVPDTRTGPEPKPAQADTPPPNSAGIERPAPDSALIKPTAFEGFGSFSG